MNNTLSYTEARWLMEGGGCIIVREIDSGRQIVYQMRNREGHPVAVDGMAIAACMQFCLCTGREETPDGEIVRYWRIAA